jgi:CHAT domain-containing protein
LCISSNSIRVTDATKKPSCLTVEDVSKLNVTADIVVLSACHTARGNISSEGVVGLAREFLMAGAKSVVTALWAIPDSATMMFMEKFYRNLREMRVGDALSTTMCQMQEEEFFKHVIQWGSFKVIGANVKVSFPK